MALGFSRFLCPVNVKHLRSGALTNLTNTKKNSKAVFFFCIKVDFLSFFYVKRDAQSNRSSLGWSRFNQILST